ncbi:MAG: hypothetical protein DU429_08740 [Candidatus Tokpelaia sp.]|nr:MAG: hypothetical protein DU429_08740 [Candidatus Tokpelaia sp.]
MQIIFETPAIDRKTSREILEKIEEVRALPGYYSTEENPRSNERGAYIVLSQWQFAEKLSV